MRKFSVGARDVAEDRQDKHDGLGFYCAKCCKNIGVGNSVPRIPISKGGSLKADNCVILCQKCFKEIGFDHPDEIPYSELPCFRVIKSK